MTRELDPEIDYRSAFPSFFEDSGISLAILNRRLQVLDANTELFQLLDRHPADVDRFTIPDLLHPQIAERMGRRLGRLAEGKERGFREQVRALVPVTATAPVTLIATALPNPGAAAVLLLCIPDRGDGREHGEAIDELDAKILEGIAEGRSTAELAAQLYLSRQGVEYHIHRMSRKFKATNRPSLVARAYALGVLAPESWPPTVRSP